MLVDYKSEDISVQRGDFVTVISVSDSGYRIKNSQNRQGTVPNYVLNLLSSGGASRTKHSWNFRKFRKPSFGKKDSANTEPDLTPPGQPRIQELKGTTAILEWPNKSSVFYTVESCKLHSTQWIKIKSGLQTGVCQIEDLEPGETYGFRIYCTSPDGSKRSEPSPPSQPVIVPQTRNPDFGLRKMNRNSCDDYDSFWQRDFERQYIELEELGRGRFGVVRRCQEILTGTEVAVKFMNRRKQNRQDTKREFVIMSKLKENNCLVSSSGLFLTATSDAIVMNL